MIRVFKNIPRLKFHHFKIATKLDLALISIDILIPPKSILIHMAINFQMSRIFLIEKKNLIIEMMIEIQLSHPNGECLF